MSILISAHRDATRDEDVCPEGHRAQEEPSARINVCGFLCFVVGAALNECPSKGKRGCGEEVHHDDQATSNETAAAFIATH